MGLRQEAKSDRRNRLVQAATHLIATRNNGNFSMPELAKEAGVSLATPYNLLGSKASVLGKVFEAQMLRFHSKSKGFQSNPPIDRIMQAIDNLVSAFDRDPDFFRNLWHALSGLKPGEHGQYILPVSNQLIQPLVSGLIEEGHILPDIPPVVLEKTLTRIFNANFEQWASLDWNIDKLRWHLQASFALVFYGLLSESENTGLEAVIESAHQNLSE